VSVPAATTSVVSKPYCRMSRSPVPVELVDIVRRRRRGSAPMRRDVVFERRRG
jgi:hypothetical protein